MAYTSVPVISGITLPRPSRTQVSNEAVRRGVALANGSSRAYNSGTRKVFELAWGKLDEATYNLLTAACAAPFTSYRHLDGATYVVETGTVQADAIAGTDPVRFSASVQLTEQTPTR